MNEEEQYSTAGIADGWHGGGDTVAAPAWHCSLPEYLLFPEKGPVISIYFVAFAQSLWLPIELEHCCQEQSTVRG